MAFFLFLLVNATLFIRPAEIVPALLGWRIYEALIISCFVAALPNVLAYFGRRSLDAQPVTLCVFGLLLAVPLSHLARLDLDRAVTTGFEFAKVVVYYVLLVSIVNTPARLRRFLFWIAVFCAAMVLVAVLRYHDVLEIQLPPPPPTAGAKKRGQEGDPTAFVKDSYFDRERQQYVEIRRLRGTGIFQDPNDICLALALAMPLCLYWLTDRRLGGLRLLWVVPLLLFCYTLYRTQSRGGFLGFVAGLMVLFHARFGWRRSLALGLATLPPLLLLFAGRITTIETGTGTGQSRIQLWSSALEHFRESPLLGIGMDELGQRMTHVAHNSYLQCYVELGLLGGTLFVGAFYVGLLALRRVGTGKIPVMTWEVWRVRPYLMAVLAGSAVCMATLTLCYVVPTYLILGLVTAYVAVGVAPSPRPVLTCDLRLVQRLALVSLGFLAVSYVFVRLMVRWA